MDNISKRLGTSYNLIKLLQNREKKSDTAKHLKRHLQFSESLIKRLGLEYELDGHEGCVNCLQWSSDGRWLASGSDDTNVIIWDPFRHQQLKVVTTPHIGNIFSVKFLGNDESFVATGAGDCRVIVQSIEHAASRQTPHLDCGCHVGRVKRLATAPDEPLLFWSAGEDGLAIQYDMREPHECLTKCKVLLNLSCTTEIKCIAVNPVNSYLIAIGANDCFIRLYDRRMIRITNRPNTTNYAHDNERRTYPDSYDVNCVQYFSPGHLAKDNGGDLSYKLATTYVAFNASGTELLVNMGGDQIYLFDTNNPRNVNELRVPNCLTRGKIDSSYKSCCNGTDATSQKNCRKLRTRNHIISDVTCACDYIERAKFLCSRKWTGDFYCAARDFLHVIQMWPENKEAYMGLIQCFILLEWIKEGYDWLDYLRTCHPDMSDNIGVKRMESELSILKTNDKKEETEVQMKPEAKALSDEEKQLRLEARDYESRFLGHCNTTTDIKEANFLGENGNYICAGSDDGIIFIWDKKTTNAITALWGDVSIVNCVQPHPSACFIASSGIDPAVKLWSPTKEDGSTNNRVVADLWAAIESNQMRMSMDPFETMLANLGYRLTPLDSSEIPTCRTS